jgi:hypothetical protein
LLSQLLSMLDQRLLLLLLYLLLMRVPAFTVAVAFAVAVNPAIP